MLKITILFLVLHISLWFVYRVEEVMSWQQNCQMLFKTVFWVVKVEQVYFPPRVKIMLTNIYFPFQVLAAL